MPSPEPPPPPLPPPSPSSTPPPVPPIPSGPSPTSPSALGTLALVAGPGLAILLVGLTLGKTSQETAIFLILGIGVLGSLVGGVLAGSRLARIFAASREPTVLATVGCCLLCMIVSAALSFGGCAVGVLSSLNFH